MPVLQSKWPYFSWNWEIKIYIVTPTLKNRPLELEIQKMKMSADLADGVAAIFVSATVSATDQSESVTGDVVYWRPLTIGPTNADYEGKMIAYF